MSNTENVIQQKGSALWEVIEGPQGYAFISDSVCAMTDKEITELAKNCLPHAERVVAILKDFAV